MREVILRILHDYIDQSAKQFKGNDLAGYIRQEPAKCFLKSALLNPSQYVVDGSAGQGNWAEIPWIAVFDRGITTTATKGYDIVYLFRSDMSGVYISLNQGWTYFKNKYGTKVGKTKIREVSNAWKCMLSSTLGDFSYEPIDLKSKGNSLAVGYELGHICGKFYSADSIPEENELVQDLNKLICVYRELKGKLTGSIEDTNDELIVKISLGELDNGDNADLHTVARNIESSIHSTLEKEKIPNDFISIEKKQKNYTPKKPDYEGKARKQKRLGFSGELMVLQYEKNFLEDNGRKELAAKVMHISKELGDGAGYDILSYTLAGEEKYIEVKTTTGPSNARFYLTNTELCFAKENSKNFFLYRIYDYDEINNSGKFFVINGDLSHKLQLTPETYIADGLIYSNVDQQ